MIIPPYMLLLLCFFFLSLSLIKSKLGVEACSISCFIYGKRCVCTAGLMLWLFFWSSFIRGCSIFISAVSSLFCPWIAPIHFCFRSWMTIQALSPCTFGRTISHFFPWSVTFTGEAQQSGWSLTRYLSYARSTWHLDFSSRGCLFFGPPIFFSHGCLFLWPPISDLLLVF